MTSLNFPVLFSKGFGNSPENGTAIGMYVSQMDVVHFVVVDSQGTPHDVIINDLKKIYNV